MKFLIVEDTVMIRRIIINCLSQFPFITFEQAGDGKEGLEILRVKEIDFVILDWVMPYVDGIEMLQNIRKNPSLKDLPVLFVTSKTEKSDIIQAITAKVDDYLTKPIDPKSLIEKINSILIKRKLQPLS